MKELVVRALSGLFYISIIIVAMFASREWFLAIFFVLGIITLGEFQKIIGLKSILSYILYAALYFFLGYMVIDLNVIHVYLILAIMVNLILMRDLLIENRIPMFENKRYITVICYLIAGFVFLTLIPLLEEGKLILIGLFILIWANDTFAYLVGKNFGKRKLLERISPKKTIEGFFGGLFGAILAGILIFNYTQTPNFFLWMGLAVGVAFLGTIGDLIESKFKRQAGVKDSGRLMPGHGGLYDRMDSMIYVSPFVYACLLIVDYVS